jgi:hypothetical protein
MVIMAVAAAEMVVVVPVASFISSEFRMSLVVIRGTRGNVVG